MEYVGIDVHKKHSQICTFTEAGEILHQRIETQRERFAAVFAMRPQVRILIEASTESEWVARCLEEMGHEVIVAELLVQIAADRFRIQQAKQTRLLPGFLQSDLARRFARL